MGLFGSGVPLAEDLRKVVVGDAGPVLKVLARSQAGIREALQPGEQVTAVAVHRYSGGPTLMVTDRRLIVVDRESGRVRASLDPQQVDQAVPTGSGVVEILSDKGRFEIRMHGYDSAPALVRAINGLLSRRPRTIPTLYPTFFGDLLAAAGTPATPTNMTRFIERTFVMVHGQANTFFEQVGDAGARAEFARRFADGGPEDRILNSVDDMIDWLWRWNPACHRPLERCITKWRDNLLMPHSFLHTNGGEITPWSEWANG